MIYTIRKTVTTHGTPEAITPGVRTLASWCTVYALHSNNGPVYVGGMADQGPLGTSSKTVAVKNEVDTPAGAYVGHRMPAGDFINLREMGGSTYIDLEHVYIDADNSGDGVIINYGRR